MSLQQRVQYDRTPLEKGVLPSLQQRQKSLDRAKKEKRESQDFRIQQYQQQMQQRQSQLSPLQLQTYQLTQLAMLAQTMQVPAQRGGRQQRLTLATGVPDSPFIADATPFFGRCEDSLMTLSYGGRLSLLDLFNWRMSDVFTKTFNFLTYVRPEMSGGNATAGHLSDPCADPSGFDYGTAKITLEDFGRYGRKGPVREILKAERYCEQDPRYRLDGTIITSEFEWDLRWILDTQIQDLYRHAMTGNASTPGQFDGMQQWINTGYESSMLDSMVFNWAGNNLNGTGGGTKTLNGVALSGTYQFINYLLHTVRRFIQRISWSPMLSSDGEPEFVLVMPTFLAECLLDAFTCWSVCAGGEFNPVNLMTYEARNFRDSLNGGRYGGGFIRLDGRVIDIFPYDWNTMHGTNRGDVYLLTTRVGNQQLWEGETLDAGAAAAEMQAEGHPEYFSTDGGRVIGVTEVDNLCRTTKAWIRPRIINRAPWLQARFMNVECTQPLDPISPDPISSFYPLTSFGGDQRLS